MRLKKWMKYVVIGWIFAIVTALISTQHVLAYQEIERAVSREEHDMHFSSGWMSSSSGHGIFYMNDELVYCIEPHVYFIEGASYHVTYDMPYIQKDDQVAHFQKLSQDERDLIGLLSHYGYGYHDEDIDHTDWKWYFITQACIWYAISSQWERSIVYENGESLEKQMNELWTLATHYASDIPSFDGREIVLNVGESITLVDENHVLQRFEIATSDGFEVTKQGSNLMIKATEDSSSNGCIELVNRANKSLQGGLSLFYIWSASNQQAAYQTCVKPIYGGQTAHVSILVKVNALGSLKIIKEDEVTHTPLANTLFEITGPHQFYRTQMTKEDGICLLEDLVAGQYTVKEVSAPSGYLVDPMTYTVNVEAGKEVVLYIQDDQPTGIVHLSKEDEELGHQAQGDATLEGAQYTLYAKEDIWDASHTHRFYQKDQVVHVFETDLQGNCLDKEHLPLGHYYLKETKAPIGYILDTKVYDISLDYQDQETSVILKAILCQDRVKKQAFQIIKVSDQSDGEIQLLKGAQFTVKLVQEVERMGWEKASIYDVLTSDQNGYALSKELPYGHYIVKETTVPDNHYPVDDFYIDITEDSRVPQAWKILNDPSFKAILQIVKVDKETGKTVYVEGTTFKIKNLETGEYVGNWIWYPHPQYISEFVTDETGSVTLPETLSYGRYQLEEIKAPYGYRLDDPIVSFDLQMNRAYELSEDNENFMIKIVKENTSTKGKIYIHKQGDSLLGIQDGKFTYEKRGLKDVVFDIYAKEDIVDPAHSDEKLYQKGDLVDTVVTDSQGQAVSKDLPLGNYEVREKQSAYGYVLDSRSYEVNLIYSHQEMDIVEAHLELENERRNIILNVHKKDERSQQSLSGATFGLYANRDIKNVDGMIIVKKDTLLKMAVSSKEGIVDFDLDLPIDNEKMKESLFRIEEIEAPQGYLSSKEIFYVSTSLEDLMDSFEINKTFYNVPTCVYILKKDAVDGHLLLGAQLQLLDLETGKVIEQWETKGDVHKIYGLEIGKTYLLKEISAPKHYACTENLTFSVEHTSEIQEIVLLDQRTYQVRIHKKDAKTKQLIPSKEMVFMLYRDENCEIPVTGVDIFYEEGCVTFKSLLAGTYYLKEVEAPFGYNAKEETVKIYLGEELPAGYCYEMDIENEPVSIEKVPTGDEIKSGYIVLEMLGASFLLVYLWMYQKRRKSMF